MHPGVRLEVVPHPLVDLELDGGSRRLQPRSEHGGLGEEELLVPTLDQRWRQARQIGVQRRKARIGKVESARVGLRVPRQVVRAQDRVFAVVRAYGLARRREVDPRRHQEQPRWTLLALIAQCDRRAKRHPCPGRVSGHDEPVGACSNGAVGGEHVVEARRIRMLGGKPVSRQDHGRTGREGKVARQRGVNARRVDAVGTAVHEEDSRRVVRARRSHLPTVDAAGGPSADLHAARGQVQKGEDLDKSAPSAMREGKRA